MTNFGPQGTVLLEFEPSQPTCCVVFKGPYIINNIPISYSTEKSVETFYLKFTA